MAARKKTAGKSKGASRRVQKHKSPKKAPAPKKRALVPGTVVLVAGLSSSGKSTQVRLLAKKFGLDAVFTSHLMRAQNRLDTREKGFWYGKSGQRALDARISNPNIDRAFDNHLLEIAQKGDCVMDSWTMPWLFKGTALRIWLHATDDARVKRVVGRTGLSAEQAEAQMRQKDDKSFRVYFHTYNIKIGEDLSPFDIVLDTTHLDEKQVFSILSAAVKARFGAP